MGNNQTEKAFEEKRLAQTISLAEEQLKQAKEAADKKKSEIIEAKKDVRENTEHGISDYIQIEPMQITTASVLSFPGLEIKQNQRRVFQDGEEVSLTRLEYSTLVYLASNPGIVLTRTQIFEAVWNMESESCQSSVANVIYNLRKKIEPDSRKPTYIKTVLGMGYKFASGE